MWVKLKMAVSRIDKIHIFILILFLSAIFLINNLMNSEMYQCVGLTPSQAQISSAVAADKSANKADAAGADAIKADAGRADTNKAADVLQDLKVNTRLFSTNVLNRDVQFNISSNDVIVFLHIQKTGGTMFGRHLVQHLEHQCNCSDTNVKRCECFRPGDHQHGIWLFSKFSTGWSCGVHADWTALNSCVPQVLNRKEKVSNKKRRYMYITQLRDPTARYLSEWRHVQRGATWPSKNMCDGRLPTSQEVPLCYKGENWIGVTLDQFLDCKWNMGNNRQTRMLADLSLVGCYNHSKMPLEDRNWLMLESARRNLRRLAYFGLTEYQVESQYLFERTFDMKFQTSFEQLEETHASRSSVTPKQLDRIAKLNALDVELYEYAKALFSQRLKYLRRKSSTNNDQ